MTSLARWLRDHVPVLLLIAAPAVGQLSVVLAHGGTWTWLLVSSGLSLVLILAVALVLLGSGWVGQAGDLLSVSLGGLARRQTTVVQQAAVLQGLVENLREHVLVQANTSSRLLSELVRSEESTRAALAAELHDTVAQTLSVAIIGLRSADAVERTEAQETVSDAEIELRAVLSRIRPPELVDGDLARAVADLCDDLLVRYDTDVEVTWDATALSLPPPVAVLVYRCIQEALFNVIEHTDGARVRLALRVVPRGGAATLDVTVCDDGPGFDPSSVVSIGGRHLGLRLLRDRARLVGGSLVVTTAPGAGTHVALSVPLVLPADTLGEGARLRPVDPPRPAEVDVAEPVVARGPRAWVPLVSSGR